MKSIKELLVYTSLPDDRGSRTDPFVSIYSVGISLISVDVEERTTPEVSDVTPVVTLELCRSTPSVQGLLLRLPSSKPRQRDVDVSTRYRPDPTLGSQPPEPSLRTPFGYRPSPLPSLSEKTTSRRRNREKGKFEGKKKESTSLGFLRG